MHELKVYSFCRTTATVVPLQKNVELYIYQEAERLIAEGCICNCSSDKFSVIETLKPHYHKDIDNRFVYLAVNGDNMWCFNRRMHPINITNIIGEKDV